MVAIKKIQAREILDSRGNPTIEVDVILENNIMGRAAVPSGASTGEHEAVELRDNDKQRYNGKGVLNAVQNVNMVIAPALIGYEVTKQNDIDTKMIELDGTKNKSKLGANAILGVSLACAKAAATSLNLRLYEYLGKLSNTEESYLPVPMMNILNGGKHADSNVDIQEFLIMPISAKRFSDALRMGAEVFHSLKKVLSERGYSTSVGDEGGFAPKLKSNEEAFDLIIEAIRLANYLPGKDIYLAIDAAASEFYNKEKGKYVFWKSDQSERTSEEMIEYYDALVKKYPLFSIEDPLDENDWDGWKRFTEHFKDTIQIVGDDLFVTNPEILKRGIEEHSANSILIKLNQIGSLTETIKAIKLAKSANFNTIVSHRSGETEDTTIADLAVGLSTGQIKTGSLSRTERLSKYNQLLRIEESMSNPEYLGSKLLESKKLRDYSDFDLNVLKEKEEQLEQEISKLSETENNLKDDKHSNKSKTDDGKKEDVAEENKIEESSENKDNENKEEKKKQEEKEEIKEKEENKEEKTPESNVKENAENS